MTTPSLAHLRREMLKPGGILPPPVEVAPRRRRKKQGIIPASTDERKTLAMRLVEASTGQQLEDLLRADKKGVDCANELNLSPATITRWRIRLGITPNDSRHKGDRKS